MNTSDSLPSELITFKSDTCKSLYGKTDLIYHLECHTDNEIYFRMAENAGRGHIDIIEEVHPQKANICLNQCPELANH